MESRPTEMKSFNRKMWVGTSIVALFVIVIWLLKATFGVLLLVLAGALIALYFHGVASLLQRKLHVPPTASKLLSTLGSLVLLLLFFWFAGDRVQQQAEELSTTLPAAFDKLKDQVNDSPFGRSVVDRISSGVSEGKVSSAVESFFSTTFGVFGDLYVILFLGIFFFSSPALYTQGFLKLIPKPATGKADYVVSRVGFTLTKWLKGKIFSMLVVFVLTAIGLAVLGIPLWLVLALIAGLLSFVPNFGPLIALIPALLIGFMQGMTTGFLVLGLYVLVQVLESNFITPQIQKKLINIPPALIILAQLLMGVLSGGWGLVLATPLIAIVMTVLQELYIKPQESS